MSRRGMRKTTYSAQSASGGWVWMRRGFFLSILGAFGYLVWYAAINREEIEMESNAVPLVKADTSPIKVRAEEPGGMEVANRDKKVFDLLTVGGPESDDIAEEVAVKVEPPKAMQTEKQPTTPQPEPVKKEDIGALLSAMEEETPKIEPKPEPKNPVATPESSIEPAMGEAKPSSGSWGVQLASFRSQAEAEKGAEKFRKKFPELMPLTLRVQQATVKGKTYHRAQFLGLLDKKGSDTLCATLKKGGQGCMSVKK